jgi:acetolactate synthase-1/2/3 large subunit
VVAPEPDEARLRRAAVLLSRAARPLLLVGSQALLSPTEADALAGAVRALGLPVYLSGMARGLLGPADPLQMRHKRKEALREADLVVLAGVPCDFRLDYGNHIGRRAVLVSANRSRAEIGKNRRPALAVPGAPELFLRGLAAAFPGPRPEWTGWRDALRARDAARDAEIAAQAEAESPGGLNPLRVVRALDEALADDSVIVADGGDFVSTASYVLRPRRPLSWLDPGPFGTLGVGAGFALGAKLVRPSADVWVVYGDGSVGYSLAEADTFARHGLGVVAVIGNDRGWTQIAREQVEVLKDDVGTVLAPTAYERAAEGLGARGLDLDDASRVAPVLREARDLARSGRPVYVNARIGRTDFRKGAISM